MKPLVIAALVITVVGGGYALYDLYDRRNKASTLKSRIEADTNISQPVMVNNLGMPHFAPVDRTSIADATANQGGNTMRFN